MTTNQPESVCGAVVGGGPNDPGGTLSYCGLPIVMLHPGVWLHARNADGSLSMAGHDAIPAAAPVGDSLAQQSPYRDVPSIATNGTAPAAPVDVEALNRHTARLQELAARLPVPAAPPLRHDDTDEPERVCATCPHPEFGADGAAVHICECEGAHSPDTDIDDYCLACDKDATTAAESIAARHVFVPAPAATEEPLSVENYEALLLVAEIMASPHAPGHALQLVEELLAKRERAIREERLPNGRTPVEDRAWTYAALAEQTEATTIARAKVAEQVRELLTANFYREGWQRDAEAAEAKVAELAAEIATMAEQYQDLGHHLRLANDTIARLTRIETAARAFDGVLQIIESGQTVIPFGQEAATYDAARTAFGVALAAEGGAQ